MGSYPIPFILLPILITVSLLISSLVLSKWRSVEEDEFSLFLPDGSDWFEETRMEDAYLAVESKKNSTGNCTIKVNSQSRSKRELTARDSQETRVSDVFSIEILGRRKDFGSVMVANISDRFLYLSHHIFSNFTFQSKGERVRLSKLCRKHFCVTPTLKLMNIFLGSFYYTNSGNTTDIQFEFPMVKIKRWDEIFPVFWLIANVTTDPSGRILDAFLLRNTISITVEKVKISERNRVRDQIAEFAKAFENAFIANSSWADSFPLELFLFTSASEELSTSDVSAIASPLLALSLGLLTIFTVLSSLRKSGRTSKPWEALAGVINPSMAIATTVGLLFLADYHWFSMLSAMTYLVLSIGVDDMFILLQAWHNTDFRLSPAERLTCVMSEDGRSVTLTSVINVASFAAGLTQNIPAVRQFSTFTSLGLAIEFLYQMTFFLGVLVIGGRREAQGRNSVLCCLHNDSQENFCCGKTSSQADENRSKCLKRFRTINTPMASSCGQQWPSKLKETLHSNTNSSTSLIDVVVLVIFTVFLVWATFTCTTLTTNLSPKKLVLRSSALHKYLEVQEETLAKEVKMANVYILNPPNFNNQSDWNSFNQLVSDLENIGNFSSGSHATILWLNSYVDFLNSIGWSDFYENIGDWLETDGAADFRHQLELGNTRACEPPLLAFQFSTFYQHFHDYSDLIAVVDAWRDVYRRYPQFNVSISSADSQLADAARSLADNVMQDTGVAFICVWMATVIVSLGETDRHSLFWVSYLLLVIEAGVIGLLKSWGQAELDTITMITITMSVGFR